MVMDDMAGRYTARLDAFQRGLEAKKDLELRNTELDLAVVRLAREVNVQFAGWLVDNAEKQQKAPREILNEIFVLTMQTKQE